MIGARPAWLQASRLRVLNFHNLRNRVLGLLGPSQSCCLTARRRWQEISKTATQLLTATTTCRRSATPSKSWRHTLNEKRAAFYEKPSEKATREKSEAIRRARKLARNKRSVTD